MAQYTKSNIRGLLLQDPRIDKDSFKITSDVTQASPIPGFPEMVTSYGSRGRVNSLGTPYSSDDDLNIYCLNSGLAKQNSAKFGWKLDGEAASYIRGWDPPWYVMNWNYLDTCWNAAALADGAVYEPKAIETKLGTVLVCYTKQDGATPDYWTICVSRKEISETGYTEYVVEDDITVFSADITVSIEAKDVKRPVMLELSTGDIMLYFWEYNSSASWFNIKAYISRDDGETWEIANSAALVSFQTSKDTAVIAGPVPFSSAAPSAGARTYSSVGTITAAEVNGAVSLFCTAVTNNTDNYTGDADGIKEVSLRQYSSSDFGQNFELVDAWGGEDQILSGATAPRLVSDGINLHLYFMYYYTTGTMWRIAKLTVSPFSSIKEIDSLEYVSGTDTSWAIKHFDITYDNSGNWYIFARAKLSTGVDIYGIRVLYSTDWGTNWYSIDNEFSGITSTVTRMVNAADIDYGGPKYATLGGSFTATMHKNSVLLFTNASGNSTSLDGSLGVFQLGGWSNLNQPSYWNNDANIINRSGLINIWTPFVKPDGESYWTLTTGTGTETLVSGYLSLSTTAGQASYYTDASSSTEDNSIIARWALKTSTTETSGQCMVSATTGTGAASYQASIRIYDTGFIVYDPNALPGLEVLATVAPVGYNSSITNGTKTHFVLAVNDSGDVSIWYYQGEIDGDVAWVLGYTGTLTSAAPATGSVLFGARVPPTTSATSRWYYFNHAKGDDYTANGKLARGVSLDDAQGMAMSPEPIYVKNGIKTAFYNGPFINKERWDIDIEYSYGIKNIFPDYSPSPQKVWRSTADNYASKIEISLFSAITKSLSTITGIYLKGINWKTATFDGWNGSSWVKICDINAVMLSSRPYSRAGDTILPSGTASTPSKYIRLNELVGCTVDLGSGVLRKVIHNTSGYWDDDAATKRPIIVLDGVDDAGDPASGTCDIWSTEVFSAGYIPSTTSYSIYRIAITATQTVDNYYTIGSSIIGPFIPFSQDYSFGHIKTLSTNVQITEDSGRRKKTKVLGEPRRVVSFAWSDGIDETKIYDLDAPTILPAASTMPASLRGDIANELYGVMEMNNGAHTPLVFISDLDYGTSGTSSVWNLTDKDKMVYGRIIGDLEIQNVLGNSQEEVYQVNTIVIEEEV